MKGSLGIIQGGNGFHLTLWGLDGNHWIHHRHSIQDLVEFFQVHTGFTGARENGNCPGWSVLDMGGGGMDEESCLGLEIGHAKSLWHNIFILDSSIIMKFFSTEN